jgi:hypothetical protein
VRGLVAALVLVTTVVSGVAAASPVQDPQNRLSEGRQAYERQHYQEAEQAMYPLLYPEPELGSEESVVEARRVLALSYFFQKKMPEARKEVLSLLQMRPNYQLNAFVEAPVAVSFFETIRKEQETRLSEIKRRQEQEAERNRKQEERRLAEERAQAQRIFIERQVHRNSRLIALVPFGIGQAQNGHLRTAILFGTSEAAFALTSLGLWITLQTKYAGGAVPIAEHDTANVMSNLQLGFGIAFWATVAAGIIDAEVRFVPEVVLKERELPKKRTSFHLSPILAPGQYGLGLQGAF